MGLTHPLPTKKPRLVSPSSGVISPVVPESPGPKRVTLKIRQPPMSTSSALPVLTVTSASVNALAPTVVPAVDTVKSAAQNSEKERKWKEAVAAATASAKPGDTVVVNDARLSPLPSHPTKFLGQSRLLSLKQQEI